LLSGAAENALLLHSDFQALRDCLEIAGCQASQEAHAILLLMLVALEEGSLCLEVDENALMRRLRDLVTEADATLWCQRILAALAPPGLPALIGVEPTDHRPVIAHDVGVRRFLYFQKYLRAELCFHAELQRRLAAKPDASSHYTEIVREALAHQPMALDPEQRRALEAALRNPLAVISGGPGTGKTFIVRTFLACLIRAGINAERIALAAPTGRAAQRLTDAIRAEPGGLSATTLHQLLGYRPARNTFSRHRENPIDADVVIVDEASMVGLVLMSQLLQALKPKARLVLLGDKDQLPSVDAGAVLASLVPQSAQECDAFKHVVLLKTNHRSQAQIRAAAEAINLQDAELVDRLPPLAMELLESQSGCRLLEQTHSSAGELRGFVERWIHEAYFRSRLDGKTLAESLDEAAAINPDAPDFSARMRALFQLLDRYRVLTLVRDSAWGCDDINRFLETQLRPRLDPHVRSALFHGAPVLITRNDAACGLYNGDVGIALRLRGGGLRVVFSRQDGFITFPAEALPAHELGFALTVHKSQGSEYGNVLVVLPPTGGRRLLTKELIYTAITRAKSLAVLCGAKESLRFAIGRKIERESGMLRT
jgi:exodeoxyribonuclease V alpha subunit